MQFRLENGSIYADFVAKGAELQVLVNKRNNVNYLWNGDAKFWGKQSPILFPIVGGLKNDTYHYQGQTFHLPRHGFARDMDFEVQKLSATEIVFRLSETEATLSVYPFRFNLAVRYQLLDNTLVCSYEIENPSPHELLFAVGGHPAFAVPLNKDLAYTDYSLTFNADEQLQYHLLDGNQISNETETIDLQHKTLPLRHELFYRDAMVFKSLKSSEISISSVKDDKSLIFKFEQFPFFGIWSAKDADFVCLEPWCGIADGVSHDQNFEHKEGNVRLTGGQKFKRTWSVAVF